MVAPGGSVGCPQTAERAAGTEAGRLVVKELVLRDGTVAMVWPLSPDDGMGLQQVYSHLCPESRYRRFLTVAPTLSKQVLHLLVDEVDGVDHVALVLVAFPDEDPEQLVGVARMMRYPGCRTVADVAVTVSDTWHGRGVATALLGELVEQRPVGVTELLTEVACENKASFAMLSRLGTVHTALTGSGVREVRVQLTAALAA